MIRALATLAVLSLSGCALAPNTIRTDVSHLSHLSQHFGDHRTNMGAEMAEVTARWNDGGAFVDLTEGYNLSPSDEHVCIGGICGPRELTEVSVGYEWRIRP